MTLLKQAASSQIAGYAQGRQGRRPIRVDTLLSKVERGPSVQLNPYRRGIQSARGPVQRQKPSQAPLTYATHDGKPVAKGHPNFQGYIKRKGNVMYPIFSRKAKQASLVPPFVHHIALDILAALEE